MTIDRICIVGAGTMGRGIAQVCAHVGRFDTRLVDVTQDKVDEARSLIQRNLEMHFVKKGKVTREEAEAALRRITGTTDLHEAAHDVHYAIEAVSEDEKLKCDVFGQLDEILPPHAIISSNTSVLSITKLASATRRPDRCIGTHFAAPVPRIRLFEAVRGLLTSDETLRITTELAERIGKAPLVCNDTPGFLLNRVLIAMQNAAMQLVVEGNRAEDVDRSVRDGMGWHIGPLQVMDNAGLDILLGAFEAIYKDLGYDPAYRPNPLLRRMVDAGLLGRKSGRGFYIYDKEDQL
jgi:3-hydroxybutyryl-CoA dehydrogenase